MSVIVEIYCDYRGCNLGEVGISMTGPDPARASIDIDMDDWRDGRIASCLPEGWTVFGTKTLFAYCPTHSRVDRI